MQWFMCQPQPGSQLNMVCFPYAGVSASVYLSWQERLPANVRVCPVVLPGRENGDQRLPVRDFDRLVALMVSELLPLLRDCHYVLYGHSMGAWLAWHLAQYATGDSSPQALIISGQQAPHLDYPHETIIEASDEEILRFIMRTNGLSARQLEQSGWRISFLNRFRNDIALCESHRPDDESYQLALPMLLFGASDDPLIPRDDMQAWQRHASGSVYIHWQSGGHLFIQQTEGPFMSRLTQHLNALTEVQGVL